MRKAMQRTGIGLLLVLAVMAMVLGGTRQGRAAVKTLLFIPQVVSGFPVRPQEWFTATPLRQRVSFPITQGEGMADIYRPPGAGPYAATLLFLGVAPAGPDDPRVTGLGEALARSNMVAMFYWSPIMVQKKLDPQDVQDLVAAFQHLRSLEYVDPERVGMGGFCVGASFVLMAAAQAPIRDQVAFVNAFGPYFDMTTLARDIATRTRPADGGREPWDVDPLTYEVFALELTAALDEQEGDLLRRAFLTDEPTTLDSQALSPPAQAVRQLLQGTTPEEVDSYLSQLPPALLARLDSVSPRLYVDSLRAPVLLMYDQDDPLIPPAESRRLEEALPGDQVRATAFQLFRHMDPTRPLDPIGLVWELGKLFAHMYPIFLQAS